MAAEAYSSSSGDGAAPFAAAPAAAPPHGRPLVALIGAGAESSDEGRPLRAALPLAGRTLIERQARLAAAAGARRIVLLVERMPADLVAAVDRLRRERLDLVVARTADEAAASLDPYDRLLVIADGLLADEADLRAFANHGGAAVATLPDSADPALHERIDGAHRWAGLLAADGALLRETAAMLRDWDLLSTLLRRALQEGAALVPAGPTLLILDGAGDLSALQRRLLDAAAPPPDAALVERRLLAPLERAAAGALLNARIPAGLPGWTGIVLAAGAIAAFAWPLLWLGLALLLLTLPLEGISARLARVRMAPERSASWRAALLPAAYGAALLSLGAALAPPFGWGMILIALMIVAFQLAAAIERQGLSLPGAAFLAEPRAMILALVPFAAFGAWAAGTILLFAWSAGSFFWAQRHAHGAARERAASMSLSPP
jgi:hypothetical protein